MRVKNARILSLLILLALPGAALACKGGEGIIQDSIHFSYLNAGFMALLFGLSFRIARRQPITGPITLFMGIFLAGHPAWTMDPYAGDCGFAKAGVAVILSMASIIVLVVQHYWAKRASG